MTNSKLYVGNLTFNASENGLREIFSEAGEVRETAIITDKTTGQSRGFAFVTMADEAGAKRACEKFALTAGRQSRLLGAPAHCEYRPSSKRASFRKL